MTVVVLFVTAFNVAGVVMLLVTMRGLARRWSERVGVELVVMDELRHTLDDLIRIAPERAESLELARATVADAAAGLRTERRVLDAASRGGLRALLFPGREASR